MLSPLSLIYSKIAEARNARFESGRSKSFDLGARTISVGNITAGGTGKTPLVILISQKLVARGKRVCILTRGYGRSGSRRRVLVADGNRVCADARTGGDEPAEMARKLQGKAIIVADRDRVTAGTWAKGQFGITTFVLDDGFQHRKAKRDVDIVCIDATNPFGGGKVLPTGRLREPLVNLKRADAIVITRADLANNIGDIRAEIAKHNSECPVFTASVRMTAMTLLDSFLSPAGGKSDEQGDAGYAKLVNTTAFAFCGIGNPAAFFSQLKKDNFPVSGARSFADHYKYRPKDIAAIAKAAESSGAGYLLTTAKDAVKLAGLEIGMPCLVLETSVVIDDDEKFSALL
jgi:tetraacyldisaccharide 4'-kinase